MNKKVIIGIVGLVVLVSLSGCLGTSTSEAPIADVDEETLNQTNYTKSDVDRLTSQQSNPVRNVNITSYMTTFQSPNNQSNAFQVPDSRYAAISTPSVKVFGRQLNPIVVDPTDKIFERVESKAADSIEMNEKADEFEEEHKTVGNITIKEYNGKIKIEEVSAEFDAKIYTSLIETDDAVVVTLASYPEAAGTDEKQKAIDLMTNTTTDDSLKFDDVKQIK